MTRVTRLIHNAGKYLLIFIYPLPTHPTHNFTHKNGGNLDKLPGWPKKNCISIDLRGAQVKNVLFISKKLAGLLILMRCINKLYLRLLLVRLGWSVCYHALCCLSVCPTLVTAALTHRGRVTYICVSKLTVTGEDNGNSPARHQAIIWTNAGILLIGPKEKLQWNLNRNSHIFIQENAFENVVWKLAATLSLPQYANISYGSRQSGALTLLIPWVSIFTC